MRVEHEQAIQEIESRLKHQFITQSRERDARQEQLYI